MGNLGPHRKSSRQETVAGVAAAGVAAAGVVAATGVFAVVLLLLLLMLLLMLLVHPMQLQLPSGLRQKPSGEQHENFEYAGLLHSAGAPLTRRNLGPHRKSSRQVTARDGKIENSC